MPSATWRRVAAGAFFCATLAGSGPARAWYFPEHVVIAHDALRQLGPDVRDVLDRAVLAARAEGLALCPAIDASLEQVTRKKPLRTRMVRSELSVECIPYGALPALAGDHASSAGELRKVLRSEKGIEITSAVAYEWRRFNDALEAVPNRAIERMSFVHELDTAFYFIDPGYEVRAQDTRAHFVDAGRPFHEVVRAAAVTGNVDNALGQFLAHHLRSLGLAAHGDPTGAILEHAFAMHFLEDAFAAGHLVMSDATWRAGNAHVRRRHDFFDAKGLFVRRAMAVERCAALLASPLAPTSLTPCWQTNGDGYLGITADASDRLHAARAVAKAEFELAIALDPERVVRAVEALGEEGQIALGQLVEPMPWWTVEQEARRDLRASAARTRMLVRGAAVAARRLGAGAPPAEVQVGTPPRTTLFEPGVLASALDVCVRGDAVDPSLVDPNDVVPCGPTRVLALGTVGVSLLRPILVDWPTSVFEADTLRGESKEDLGWAAQLLATAQGGALFPPRAPVDFFAPSIGIAAGLSYRWGTYLPGRVDRALAEVNVGISEALHYDAYGHAGGNPHATMLDEEVRWPIVWELLTSYLLPLDLGKGHEAGNVVFLSGIRVHELITTPAPVFWGIEAEALAIALSRGSGVYPLYTTSPELRVYVGAADPTVAQPSFPRAWAPMLGIALTGGYATFL
jgi:hypothetical protein